MPGTHHCACSKFKGEGTRRQSPDRPLTIVFSSCWGSKEVETTGQDRLQLKAMSTFPQLPTGSLSTLHQGAKAASSYSALQKGPPSGLIPASTRHTPTLIR